jgi:glucans biosynthesis protein C
MAMFLVIGSHVAFAYVEHEVRGVLWCVRDSPTLPIFDWFCWWSMGVSNPLYFTIAGFFAVMLYDSRGVRGFVANRWRRLVIPFLVSCVTILPACLAAWAYGWWASQRCTWREIRHVNFRDPLLQTERYGPTHLWFLEYLIVMSLAYAVARCLLERKGSNLAALQRVAARLIGSPWAPFLLTIPTIALLWVSRDQLGLDAASDRRNSFLINPMKLLHLSCYFVVGVGIYSLRRDLARIARPAPWYLAFTIPVFFARAWLLGQDQIATLRGTSALVLVASGALFSWLMIFGAIGAAYRVFRNPSPTLSYLADSSFWIYLVHMPILGLIQGDLYLVPGHALWKAPVVLVITLAIGFGSYQCLVRHTKIGERLHGRRNRAEVPMA